jgi:hypothetical protein
VPAVRVAVVTIERAKPRPAPAASSSPLPTRAAVPGACTSAPSTMGSICSGSSPVPSRQCAQPATTGHVVREAVLPTTSPKCPARSDSS